MFFKIRKDPAHKTLETLGGKQALNETSCRVNTMVTLLTASQGRRYPPTRTCQPHSPKCAETEGKGWWMERGEGGRRRRRGTGCPGDTRNPESKRRRRGRGERVGEEGGGETSVWWLARKEEEKPVFGCVYEREAETQTN